MVELVDTEASKTSAEKRESSSLSSCTQCKPPMVELVDTSDLSPDGQSAVRVRVSLGGL